MLDRRSFLTTSALAGLSTTTLASSAIVDPNRRRALRLAHMCDVHVQPERAAPEGMAEAYRLAQSRYSPDLIINGGDQIMDALRKDRSRVRTQFDLWSRVIEQTVTTPMLNVIGNHDVWGWDREDSKTTGNEDLYGKKWALDVFGLRERFYSLDRNGWHIVVLDSTHPAEGGGGTYTAKLDEAQFEWLAGDLASTPTTTPVMVVSHIPILAACTFLDGDNEESGNWRVPGAWMHIDARRLKTLFHRHPNVKLCLSGHVHLADVVEYLGVTYVCNHAVSGGWWKGPRDEFACAFGLVDLYDDGSFETSLVNTGWEARE